MVALDLSLLAREAVKEGNISRAAAKVDKQAALEARILPVFEQGGSLLP